MDELKYIFENVNGWLKYSESKNAILLGACGTVLFGTFNITNVSALESSLLKAYVLEAIVLLAIGFLVSAFSFIPKLRYYIPVHIGKNTSIGDNIYFFRDLKDMDVDDLLITVTGSKKCYTNIEVHLAEQIIINSKITYAKFKAFDCAFWIVLTGLITPILSLPIFLIYTNTNGKQ